MLLLLNVYKVFVVNTEPRLHFGAQCNVRWSGELGIGFGFDGCFIWMQKGVICVA